GVAHQMAQQRKAAARKLDRPRGGPELLGWYVSSSFARAFALATTRAPQKRTRTSLRPGFKSPHTQQRRALNGGRSSHASLGPASTFCHTNYRDYSCNAALLPRFLAVLLGVAPRFTQRRLKRFRCRFRLLFGVAPPVMARAPHRYY